MKSRIPGLLRRWLSSESTEIPECCCRRAESLKGKRIDDRSPDHEKRDNAVRRIVLRQAELRHKTDGKSENGQGVESHLQAFNALFVIRRVGCHIILCYNDIKTQKQEGKNPP